MDINKILQLSSKAGRIILENGGETYRVEETICRICSAFGFKEADSFVTPTGMMSSIVDDEGKTVSLVKRISRRTVNLEKISRVNDLSRRICSENLSVEFVEEELKVINKLPSYKEKITVVAAAVAAGFFTLLYGGNMLDFLIAALIGVLIRIISIKLMNLNLNIFIINILSAATAAFVALAFTSFIKGTHSDNIIIGSIMLLVPGLAITNAIRDTIEGDLVSGVARAMEAFFIAISVAAGTGIVLKLWIYGFGGIRI
ncbi:MAG TPA: threonine/serine exporter family protein [Clostridiaceae bacterium]